MTRNIPRANVLRALVALTPALLVTGIAVALVGGGRATEASAGAVPSTTPNPSCLTDDLAGTVTGQPGTGAREAALNLTNISGHACEIRGWADVALVTAPGDVVRVPTRKSGTASPTITLEPGAAAWSRLQWDSCAAGRAGCGVGVTFQFIVDPDSTGVAADLAEFPEADEQGITMKTLRIFPLQPAGQD